MKVSNTGKRDGEEIVQVYVGMENPRVERQKKLLKGFEKVAIRAGETADVTISIPLDELRYYDMRGKEVAPGARNLSGDGWAQFG